MSDESSEPNASGKGGEIHLGAELDRVLREGRLGEAEPAHPEQIQKGVASLVLTLVETLRELMERQALRRMDSGSLTDEEMDRLGEAFLALRQRVEELKESFGLQDEDLNLDLGPLGRLR